MSVAAELNDLGFAVVRGLFTPDEVREISRAFDRLVDLARSGGPFGDAAFVIDSDPFRLHRVVWCGAVDATLGRLGGDRRFLELAGQALDRTDFDQIIQQAHFKFPGDGVDFAWHQDASNRRYGSDLWTDLDGRGSFVQIALAVDAMTPDNGPLRMIPGSHRRGFFANPTTGVLPQDQFDPADAVDVELEPGDVALFGPFVVHGSSENTSDQSRRLFLQGYAVPGANRRVYPGCGTGVRRTL